MNSTRKATLIVLCGAAVLLFNAPVLSIFNVPAFVGGIPVFYLYLFAAWLFIILTTVWVVRRTDNNDVENE
jgi:putative Ca2+/H+ antiporter (TMEM165/GDT1 family)